MQAWRAMYRLKVGRCQSFLASFPISVCPASKGALALDSVVVETGLALNSWYLHNDPLRTPGHGRVPVPVSTP